MKIKLGQLFLLRRDLKTEVGALNSETTSLIAYREDKDSTKEDYFETMENYTKARTKLHEYDLAIEKANAASETIDFKDKKYSLNEARHLKVHVVAELGFYENLVRHAASFGKRVERENVYEQVETANGTVQAMKQYDRKFVVIPELKELKLKVKELQKDVQLLDSAIQNADWNTEVEIPE